MDIAATLTRVHEQLEDDRVENAVMTCLRIARATGDHFNAVVFLRELYPNKGEIVRALYEETQHLNADAKRFLFEKSLERYLELHTIQGIDDREDVEEGERRNVLGTAAGELEAEIARWQGSLNDFIVPPGLSAYDAAAFADAAAAHKGATRARIAGLHTIKSRLKARCLNYAIALQRQLDAQQKQEGFLQSVQNEVHNYFKGRADDVVQKLLKASQLGSSKDGEDCALLLTEVRRAMKAAADHFWPVVSEGPVRCADGNERKLGNEQYLNRLQEFIRVNLRNSRSRELVETELDHLEAFFRRLNDLASKGVHDEVTWVEARQGLVGLYFFLSNLIRHSIAATPEQKSA